MKRVTLIAVLFAFLLLAVACGDRPASVSLIPAATAPLNASPTNATPSNASPTNASPTNR